jgi:DNA modification methylase
MADGYQSYTKEFSKVNNDFPSAYTNKIVQADSLSILKQLPDNSVDLVFTSPPYNFGMGYDTHDDKTDWPQYFEMLWAIFDECIRVTKYGGRIIVNTQPLFSEYIPSHHMISKGFIDRGLIWKAEILWEKNHRNCAYTAWGSWKSPSGPYFKYTWEFLEVFCKGTLKHEGDSKKIDITGNEFKTWVDAKWSIAPERNMKDYGHPAMFPVELAYRALKLFSYQDDVILDPFNGAGTTTFVAHRTGRRYLGIDLSAEYCATADRRIQEEEIKDFAAVLDAKLALEGKDKSLKERGEIPNHKKENAKKLLSTFDNIFTDVEQYKVEEQ